MKDIITLGLEIAVISFLIMSLASWYSLNMLQQMGIQADRFNNWFQLRLKARRAGLVAYRCAVKNVLDEETVEEIITGK